jgi:hypothetical protein
MYSELVSLRENYVSVKSGGGDILAIRDQALSILKRLKDLDNPEILEELDDILLDLEFTLNNVKCNCHSRSCLKK